MARHLLTDVNDRQYMLSTSGDADIAEVGTNVFSLRGTPLSAYYDKQYKVSEGEVIVVWNSSVIAVIEDFDAEFEVGAECNLQDVAVENAAEEKTLLYIAPGEGILNEGVEVFKDPCGTALPEDGVYYVYKFVLTVEAGVVTEVREATAEDPNGALDGITLYIEDEKGNVTKARVYFASRGDLVTVGATLYADDKGAEVTEVTSFTFKYYTITLEEGVVVSAEKGAPTKRTARKR